MEYRQYKDLMPSLRALHQKGGQFQKAAAQVTTILGRVSVEGIDPLAGMKVTDHGESRISKCIKYHLTGFSRLITIQDNGIILLCFAGEHTVCDEWLDKNRGLTLIADDKGRLNDVPAADAQSPKLAIPSGPSALIQGKLFEGLPEIYFDKLVINMPRKIVRSLELLESINEESDFYEITKDIADSEQSQAIYDVFVLLRQAKREEALTRTKLYLGENRELSELTEEEIKRLAESDKIKTIPASDARFQVVFEHFVKSASYMDWMLFLHPDQQYIVDKDFPGPAKLIGVSGSGKTCIIVKRAIRLAEKYSGEKILLLTLNRQLARLIDDMVSAASPEDVRKQIEVKPFFLLCQDLLKQFEPQNEKLYDDVTWKAKEHIDEIWREYYRCELNNHDAKLLFPLHDSLIARKVNAEKYIREEFDWIRSAVSPDIHSRKKYLKMERIGRGYALDEKYRHLLLDGLRFWEKKMRDIGVTDYLGIATALYHHVHKLKPSYRSILIDESQDFGTIEYKIIRQLVPLAENDLFFCGDAAQQVSAKHRSFSEAGISIPPQFSLQVKKNYRNSREILNAAYDVLYKNWSPDLRGLGDFEILDPEYANFNAAPPLMMQGESLEAEIAYALACAYQDLNDSANQKACIAFAGYSLYEVQQFGALLKLPVLDGSTKIDLNQLFLSDLEHTKGFEFDLMIIVNCNEDILPDKTKPEQDQIRDLARFYVAMTRAKNQLILSHSSNKSSFIAKAEEYFLSDNWSSYVDNNDVVLKGVPPTLDDIRRKEFTNEIPKLLLDMTGPEFLYSDHAIGLNSLLIEKIRKLISGKKKMVNGVPAEWQTLRMALEDTKVHPRSRQVFGQEGYPQFCKLLESLHFP